MIDRRRFMQATLVGWRIPRPGRQPSSQPRPNGLERMTRQCGQYSLLCEGGEYACPKRFPNLDSSAFAKEYSAALSIYSSVTVQ
jgi:hypothetical protein